MADTVSPEERSRIMARVKGKNTTPEIIVRKMLHNMGYRFRLHRSDLPGKPDIVLPKYNTVIFVNGCFWHGHKNCKRARRPSSNQDYWENKINRNMKRDKNNQKNLKKNGWNVIVIWECEIKETDKLSNKLRRLLAE